jgi:aminomethyltransferase
MAKRTPLYDQHVQSGAQLVDFSGWDMPLHYGSQMEEHRLVRQAVGMFDVSHMGVIDIEGRQATDFLRYALANDVEKLKTSGKALYSCMLNPSAGVVDDLIVYKRSDDLYRVVLNAGTRDTDLAWLNELAETFHVTLQEQKDLAILAVQGPNALSLLEDMWSDTQGSTLAALRPFTFFIEENVMVARTGYTGEDGVEIIAPSEVIVMMWQDLLKEGVQPCGLGARDTLRLEAGYNLYGADMDQNTSPLVSNLSWTVSLKDASRDFVGRAALEKEKTDGADQKLVGLLMTEPGVLRNHQTVFIDGVGEGEITSGSFSPTLNHAIALARVPVATADVAAVERRGKRVEVTVVKPPFYKKEN